MDVTNGAQFHLLLNHLPVIVPVIGACVLLAGWRMRSREVSNVALAILVAGALAAIPTYLTGASAESVVKNYPGANRMIMREHESSALLALIALEISGALALVFLISKKIPRVAWTVLLILSLSSFALVARTAHLGGVIRHEEIRAP